MKAINFLESSSGRAPKEWEALPEVVAQRPKKFVNELSLQRFDGTDICQWHYRTMRDVFWHPYGNPILIKAD